MIHLASNPSKPSHCLSLDSLVPSLFLSLSLTLSDNHLIGPSRNQSKAKGRWTELHLHAVGTFHEPFHYVLLQRFIFDAEIFVTRPEFDLSPDK